MCPSLAAVVVPVHGAAVNTGPGLPVYATDGVENNAISDGMVVYRTLLQKPGRNSRVDHLNPQTMDHE
jgi:hypothetical protein